MHARTHCPELVVADDDRFVCSMLATQLEFKFECVATAGNADDAIALVREHRPDVAILDVVMPAVGRWRRRGRSGHTHPRRHRDPLE